jgi:catechol 2,3-dioxygenase-like lactoylglutathione lyase family enzyme
MGSDQNPQQRVMPTLRMTSYERSKEFYVGRLGFRVDWEHRFEPGFPVFMQVSRDGLAFFLTEHTGDCPVGGLVHLYVPDVDVWFNEFRDNGVAVQEPPDEYLQGLRSMTIQDPDGNKLHICTRLPAWQRQAEQLTSTTKNSSHHRDNDRL